MYRFIRTAAIVFAFVINGAAARAQTAVDPTGHWEGIVQVPGMDIAFQIDFTKNGGDAVIGTVNIPAEKLAGLPLRSVVVEGRSIRFQARTDQYFDGTIVEEGRSISGSYHVDDAAVPFTMTRTGDARMAPPTTSAPIGKELEGRWTATMNVGGGMRLVLTMQNHEDGTSSGIIENQDQGGLQIPVKIEQDGTRVVLDITVVGGSFAATLNASGNELAGTYTQKGKSVPLTFTRAAAR
jgi:hypothetical protein